MLIPLPACGLACLLLTTSCIAGPGEPSVEEVLTRSVAAAEPDPQGAVKVPAGGDLQAALDAGGEISLEPGATYEALRFTVSRSGTTIRGNGATLRGSRGPALHVRPGVSDVTIEHLDGVSAIDQAVFQLGDNERETQGALEQVPRRITLRNVRVLTHRGKRGIEVNAAEVRILDGEVSDLWDPALRDSQAIWIGNTPGPVLVEGGSYSAGSEVILVGGDTTKIPGVVPGDLTFRNLRLWRPLSWQRDGVKRAVKTIFELKTGHRVRVSDVVMDGSWVDAQTGFAVTLTPTRGGSIVDALFERVTMRNVGGGFNITGTDSHGLSDVRTTGIVVRDSHLITDSGAFGGRGILALIGGGVGRIVFEGVTAIVDGSNLIHQSGEPMEALALRDSHVVAGEYGLNLGGTANAGKWQRGVKSLDVSGNTFGGASAALRRNLRGNRFLSRAEFEALFENTSDWRLKRGAAGVR